MEKDLAGIVGSDGGGGDKANETDLESVCETGGIAVGVLMTQTS